MKKHIFIKILCCTTILLLIGSWLDQVQATTPSKSELELANSWFKENIKDSSKLPFSFLLEEEPAQSLLKDWEKNIKTLGTKDNITSYKILYSSPKSSLKFNLKIDVFEEYPAVEWMLEIENSGSDTTGILKDILGLDIQLDIKKKENVILHHAKGSDHRIDDFAPLRTELMPGKQLNMAPNGGRSSDDTAFPFFNIEREAQGVVVAIGWTGQWAAELLRKGDGKLALKAGMENTHLRLYPGEKIRTPKTLLLFWQGKDRMRGHNMMRQFMLVHHSPKIDGKPAVGPFACNGGSTIFRESEIATEHNMIALAERYQQFGLKADYWWIDAGWYGSMDFKNGSWYENVGNWWIRKEHFPNGFKPIVDAVNEMGMKFILWFEPERVRINSWLYNEHPKWLLKLDSNPNNALLDLGNPEALQWVIDYVSGMITENNIDVYRQDFNIRPLGFWEVADSPDRIGMTEIKYIEGLYKFWDELKLRHPQLLIDNCASGGRRLDLETTTRSFPLWRSDYSYHEPNGRQNHTYGLSFYLPNHGTGCFAPDVYRFRSAMSSALICAWNLYETDFPIQKGKYLMDQYRKVKPYFWGDFYPLTDFSKNLNDWMVYQFHRTDLKEGMVLFFRRPNCERMDQHVFLKGLSEKALYELYYKDSNISVIKSGKELLGKGVSIRLVEKNSSALITYKLVED